MLCILIGGISLSLIHILEGMKENVICGHLIPAGTGQREFEKIIVGSKEEYDRIDVYKRQGYGRCDLHAEARSHG